mgnify:CR=1 FL=1
METAAGLKQVGAQLSLMADRVGVVNAKLEDLLFRAQRISAAAKNGLPSSDTMYGHDLHIFRGTLRTFKMDISVLPTMLGAIERQAVYDEGSVKYAQEVMRCAARLAQAMKALHEMSLLAHQHIRTADHKMEAWYIAQEIEDIAQQTQSLPMSANKIIIIASTPPRPPDLS